MKQTTIFRQLIYNIVFPVVVALLILGIINFRNTRIILKESSEEKNFLISDEITQILKFQDITLSILEENINPKLEHVSNKLATDYLLSTNSIELVKLDQIRAELGLDPKMYDIYVLDTNGVVVNTTFTRDLGLNFFDFGEEHKSLIQRIFAQGGFVSEKFTVEANTRRLKKYTYQPTLDGNYIIELGVYSPIADNVINIIKNSLEEFSAKQDVSAELFMNADNPFSLTKMDKLEADEANFIKKRFALQDTTTIEKRVEGRFLSTQYLYMHSEDSELYKGSIIRILTDHTNEMNMMYFRLISFVFIFLIVLATIIVLIYQKTRLITNPIKNLVLHVNRISNGNLSERADVVGNNEIATLSKKFNVMIGQLEELYNDLDKKVKERTAEVVAQKEEIESQRDAIGLQRDQLAEQQKHIMDSIHYAKRLQNAILPRDSFVKELFPESFILYYPKDIVSGDFYWFFEKGSRRYFSAIDCTGHGVPGALVSMVGNNWLDYAVKDLQRERPADILMALNQGVTSTFKERNEENAVKDGMDLALCCIDYETMKLEYSGAYNPLVMVRDGELIQIKADRFPIGAFSSRGGKDFTNHEIDIQKGDMIYVFSDGYADQFGGPNGRKFLFKNFKKLLIETYSRSIEKQYEHLENTLFDWMASESQLDDILVIGIKV